MKKLSVIVLCTLLAIPFSQKAKAGDFGIRAGWQSALLTYSGGENSDALSSFYLGAFKENNIIPLLKYGLGLEYAQMGGTDELVGDYKLGYVGIPLYIKAELGPVFALAGSGINFNVSETKDIFTESVNAIDVPVYVGLGVKILMLSVEARYHWGMIEIQEETKNAYLQLGLALQF